MAGVRHLGRRFPNVPLPQPRISGHPGWTGPVSMADILQASDAAGAAETQKI